MSSKKYRNIFNMLAILLAGGILVGPMSALAETRSIHRWAVCDGKTDDAKAVAGAFAAAANGAFTLQVDCPVYMHVGRNISRPVFVDSGTTVQFTPTGLFKLDNSLIPSFVLANSKGIKFDGWQIEYVGAESLTDKPGFYCDDKNKDVPGGGSGCLGDETYVVSEGAAPSAQFLGQHLQVWLKIHRRITYQDTGPDWHNPANISALFYIIGDTSDVTVSNMRLFAPKDAGDERFMPMIFTMLPGARNGQTVTKDMENSPAPAAYAVPHGLTFTNIDIDGAYMSWQGTARDVTITHVRSHRYGSLQDAQGGNIGGPPGNRWFPPPHLFYFNFDAKSDPRLHNSNIHISDVIDYGDRIGAALDTPRTCCSGNALSLKIGADDSTVDNYISYRPDGLADILNSSNLTLSNIKGVYDSSFMHDLYPGIRFPLDHYHRVTLENVTLTDKAQTTQAAPIYPPGGSDIGQITFKAVGVIMNRWAGNPFDRPGYPYIHNLLPYAFKGEGDDIRIDYFALADHSKIVATQTASQALRFTAFKGAAVSDLR